MDRAEKVKIYKKSRKNRIKYTPRGTGGDKKRLFGITALAIVLLAGGVVFLQVHNRHKQSGLAYVSETEFASLMSFLTDGGGSRAAGHDVMDGAGSQAADRSGGPALTQDKMKAYVQTVGLSEMISVPGGKDKLSRAEVMDYYSQILDYLDLEGNVRKKNVLILEKSAMSCRTDKGKFQLKSQVLQLEPFHTYEVYAMDKTLLGVVGESDKAATLKDVRVISAEKDVNGATGGKGEKHAASSLGFEYQEKEYQVSYSGNDGLKENDRCTLRIQNGEVLSVQDIKASSPSAQASAKEPQTVQKSMPNAVRVLLLNGGGVHYSQVYLICDGDCTVKNKKKKKFYKKSEIIHVKKHNLKKGNYITISPQKEDGRLYLMDAKGNVVSNGYYGDMEVYRDAEGYYIVNDVPIEKYLYSVVASEMPASFAPEALKAQAVCARSYVYRQMAAEDYSAYHAQIDDSTNYQVYNRSEVSDVDVKAVEETAGEVMYAQGELVNAYYYSASCGFTSGMEIWDQKGLYPYLKAKPLVKGMEKFDLSKESKFRKYITKAGYRGYDSGSPYFRWNVSVELSGRIEQLKETIQSRRDINPSLITLYATSGARVKKVSSLRGFGGVEKMYCAKRSKSGAVLKLVIGFEFGRAEIKSEYNIRSILGCALEKITYANQTENTTTRFLPSAYFSLSFHKKSGRYYLAGGGNGHGMGMSQYAADGMAKEGWDYKKILTFFYDGASIKKIR